MASPNKYNLFTDDLCKGVMNLDTNVVNCALYTTFPAITVQVYTTTNELTTTAGYTAGGMAISSGSGQLSNASGTESMASLASITWTASGAGLTFRYPVYYNATPATKTNIAYYDYGGSLALSGANGDQFVVTPTSTKILTLV